MGKIRIDNGYVRLCLFCAAGLAIGIGVRLIVDMLSNMEHSISWNGGEYFGEETNGIPNGNGRFEKQGNTYSGDWTDGVLAYGRIETEKYVYEGEIDDFKINGFGICKYKDGHSYRGYWVKDNKEGLGLLRGTDGHFSFGYYKEGIVQKSESQDFNVGDRVYGIDVSKYQGVIKWQDLYMCCYSKGGVDGKYVKNSKFMQPVFFAFIKSTEGTTLRDTRFEGNFSEAKRCGIIRGAYHFLTMTASAKAQAEFFISNSPLEKGDLPPMLDLEKNTNNGKSVSDAEFSKIIPIAKEWLSEVKKHFGVAPIIYTNMNIYKTFVAVDPVLRKYDLWIANPGTTKPEIANCRIWQFSHNGKINGIPESKVDLNLFNGNYADFEKFVSSKGIK